MTMKTKSRGQSGVPAATDLAEMYTTALIRRDGLRRAAAGAMLDSAESSGYRRAAAGLSGADAAVNEARAALQAAQGPAAVRLAEARAEHSPVAAELAAAHGAWRGPGPIAELTGRERAAQLRVEQAAAESDAERSRAEAREQLEADSGPLLAELNVELAGSRDALADAVRDAVSALTRVDECAKRHTAVAAEARRRLARAGFDSTCRFDGTARPTMLDPLRVAGTAWPAPHQQRVVAAALHRAVTALGYSNQPLDYALRPHIGVDAGAIDALLGNSAGMQARDAAGRSHGR